MLPSINNEVNIQLLIIIKMCKQKDKNKLEKSRKLGYKIKHRLIAMITAFMIGMSNAMYNEDKSLNENQYRIEQKDKKE